MPNLMKSARLNLDFTQKQAAKFLGISLRSYKTYETDKEKQKSYKYTYFLEQLKKKAIIDEEHGILTIDKITKTVSKVFKEYDIDYCYLFGSYAKGKQKEVSDIDLLISGKVKGIKFFGLVEKLRSELHKKVDLLDINQLNNNPTLTNEVLKDGIKIYG